MIETKLILCQLAPYMQLSLFLHFRHDMQTIVIDAPVTWCVSQSVSLSVCLSLACALQKKQLKRSTLCLKWRLVGPRHTVLDDCLDTGDEGEWWKMSPLYIIKIRLFLFIRQMTPHSMRLPPDYFGHCYVPCYKTLYTILRTFSGYSLVSWPFFTEFVTRERRTGRCGFWRYIIGMSPECLAVWEMTRLETYIKAIESRSWCATHERPALPGRPSQLPFCVRLASTHPP